MIEEFKGNKPEIDSSCYVHETAVIIGMVKAGRDSSIWPHAVLRGDFNSISIGERSNIQDNATVHIGPKNAVAIGNNVTVGHNCVVHGCTIRDNCLIGMGAVVLNGAVIEENCIIGAGAVVTEGKVIPKNSLVLGVPGKVVRELNEEDIARIKKNAQDYVDIVKGYRV